MPARKGEEVTDADTLDSFERWLAACGGSASFEDAAGTGDRLLVAGFLLRGFRRAVREGVFDRLEADSVEGARLKTASSLFFDLIDRVAAAWSVTREQKLALLALSAQADLEVLREASFSAVPPETLQRGALLLDIFIQLNAILPDESYADGWIQRPNTAPLFSGNTALSVMLEGGLGTMHAIRGYLRGVALGP